MRRSFLLALLPLLLLAACHVVGPERFVVFYGAGSSTLDQQGQLVLATVAQRAKQRPGATVTLNGFADPVGSAGANMLLAARRAQAVADALAAAGVDPKRIVRHAVGGVDYSLDSIESRRVEITLGEP